MLPGRRIFTHTIVGWIQARHALKIVGRNRRLLFLPLLFSGMLQAQWTVHVKNLYLNGNNTQLLLQYEHKEQGEKKFQLTTSFRKLDNNRVVYEKEFSLTVSSNTTYPIGYKLPEGNYMLYVLVSYPGVNEYQQPIQVSYQCKEKARISDICLTGLPISFFNPHLLIPTHPLDAALSKLYYYAEVYGDFSGSVSATTILCTNTGTLNDNITYYHSLSKNTQELIVKNGKAVLAGQFDIAGMPEGEYLIQIDVFDDRQHIGHSNAFFSRKSSILGRIYQDLDLSIAMLKHIHKDGQTKNLQKPATYEDKKSYFTKVWQELNPEDPETEMTQYYKKIYSFVDSIALPGEIWDSDRAKIYVQYGKPDANNGILRFSKGSRNYERWIYKQFHLSFTFEQRNNRFILIQ